VKESDLPCGNIVDERGELVSLHRFSQGRKPSTYFADLLDISIRYYDG
jgi:hypothetical protein